MDQPAGESQQESGNPRRAKRDGGFSLIEIVVSVTLLGVASASILAALGASTHGSARHREVATATAWLQSAADELETELVTNCGGDALTDYTTTVKTVANSDNWNPNFITVTDVKWWNGSSFGTTCYDDVQLVSLRVASPNGKVTQTLDVVKGNPYTELSVLPADVDPYSSCTMFSWTWSSRKSGAVSTSGGVTTLKLKKPSTTKQSKVIDDHITITVKTTGTCSGKLRLYYQWPHYNKNGTLKHYHTRRINLKLVRGTTDTWVGKFGHHGDKYYANQTIDISVQQGRKKSKTWGTIISGQQDDKVTFG